MIVVYLTPLTRATVKPPVVKLKPQPRKPKLQIESNPLVRFDYPCSNAPWVATRRTVRVIAADNKYVWGLEVSDKNRPKKFLRDRMTSTIHFVDFAVDSMPR